MRAVIAVVGLLAAIASFAVVASVWRFNRYNRPTYAAMSHSADESYAPPRDSGRARIARSGRARYCMPHICPNQSRNWKSRSNVWLN